MTLFVVAGLAVLRTSLLCSLPNKEDVVRTSNDVLESIQKGDVGKLYEVYGSVCNVDTASFEMKIDLFYRAFVLHSSFLIPHSSLI